MSEGNVTQKPQPQGEEEKPLKIPLFFPLVAPGCKEVAKTFFTCLTDKSKELDDQEKDMSEALTFCGDSLKAYTVCMEDHYEREDAKRNKKKRFFGLF